MATQISLYIPTLKVSCDANRLIYVFWKFGLGKIDRVDFVPIMIPVIGKTELEEDRRFKKAFIYLDVQSSWHPDIIKAVEEEKPYKFYPNRDEHFESLRDDSYWLLLKNKSPVPYTTTSLNVHQLAHNNTLLEAKVSDMEAEILKMKLEIERIQVENSKPAEVVRVRCDSHSTTESEAEAFVNSLENIMRMNEEQQGIFHDENGLYQDYIRERMYSGFRCTDIGCNHSNEEDESSKWCDHSNKEEEEDEEEEEEEEEKSRLKGDISILGWIQSTEEEYDDSGEMSPRGKKEGGVEVCIKCGLTGDFDSLGWRHADENLCLDCLKLSCLTDDDC